MANSNEKQNQKFSDVISSFSKSLTQAKLDYEYCKKELDKRNKLTQDYLHKLELEDCKYKERAKIATSLAKCRQERREFKDTMMILEPMIEFLSHDKNKTFLDQLGKILGDTRKVEKLLKSRTYYPRVLAEDPIEDK